MFFEPVEGQKGKVFEIHPAVAVYVAGDDCLAARPPRQPVPALFSHAGNFR